MQGYQSLYNSKIHGINYLDINGNEALDDTIIVSETFNDVNTFTAIINGMCKIISVHFHILCSLYFNSNCKQNGVK